MMELDQIRLMWGHGEWNDTLNYVIICFNIIPRVSPPAMALQRLFDFIHCNEMRCLSIEFEQRGDENNTKLVMGRYDTEFDGMFKHVCNVIRSLEGKNMFDDVYYIPRLHGDNDENIEATNNDDDYHSEIQLIWGSDFTTGLAECKANFLLNDDDKMGQSWSFDRLQDRIECFFVAKNVDEFRDVVKKLKEWKEVDRTAYTEMILIDRTETRPFDDANVNQGLFDDANVNQVIQKNATLSTIPPVSLQCNTLMYDKYDHMGGFVRDEATPALCETGVLKYKPNAYPKSKKKNKSKKPKSKKKNESWGEKEKPTLGASGILKYKPNAYPKNQWSKKCRKIDNESEMVRVDQSDSKEVKKSPKFVKKYHGLPEAPVEEYSIKYEKLHYPANILKRAGTYEAHLKLKTVCKSYKKWVREGCGLLAIGHGKFFNGYLILFPRDFYYDIDGRPVRMLHQYNDTPFPHWKKYYHWYWSEHGHEIKNLPACDSDNNFKKEAYDMSDWKSSSDEEDDWYEDVSLSQCIYCSGYVCYEEQEKLRSFAKKGVPKSDLDTIYCTCSYDAKSDDDDDDEDSIVASNLDSDESEVSEESVVASVRESEESEVNEEDSGNPPECVKQAHNNTLHVGAGGEGCVEDDSDDEVHLRRMCRPKPSKRVICDSDSDM